MPINETLNQNLVGFRKSSRSAVTLENIRFHVTGENISGTILSQYHLTGNRDNTERKTKFPFPEHNN